MSKCPDPSSPWPGSTRVGYPNSYRPARVPEPAPTPHPHPPPPAGRREAEMEEGDGWGWACLSGVRPAGCSLRALATTRNSLSWAQGPLTHPPSSILMLESQGRCSRSWFPCPTLTPPPLVCTSAGTHSRLGRALGRWRLGWCVSLGAGLY